MTSTRARAANATSTLERLLFPSAVLLQAQTALAHAIHELAVSRTDYDPTTLDLLMRLRFTADQQLRGVDLCRQLLKSPSHVSRLIDRAERDGFVQRRADPDDRRAQRIMLTRAGARAVDQFTPHLTEVLNQTVYATLTTEEIETLVDLLVRLAASARQLVDGQGPPDNIADTRA